MEGIARDVHIGTKTSPARPNGWRTVARGKSLPQGASRVDLAEADAYTDSAKRSTRRVQLNEADVSAKPTPAGQDSWVPRANEDQRWAEGIEAAAGKGAQTAERLSRRLARHERLTGRAEFQALFEHGKRVERRSLIVRWRETDTATRAGFAVSRLVRGAVRRNRVRRRLREAYRATREAAPACVALVVFGRPGALSVEFGALVDEMRDALVAIPDPRRRP